VELLVCTVSVEFPLPLGGRVMDVGLNVQVAAVGQPLMVRLTVPVKPLNEVAVAV